ncbi:Clavaminate synthase-like protein [Coemansia reversa NRRL 1564]|uniref:Clavaminate synthase-like protein n=1 Tax=Coemansia reversa (strain ATCC 12441 / NRRL 1564) TaxID=763665 RepID=A0A2G5BF41_COERN|nr:Clavaminate synthase-like protein [Coemansia reversa NRRL 1564]|eukprot:PIA17611.1 Clavaminate synthase-like protein [Coemansia reversa NRRL 1564]
MSVNLELKPDWVRISFPEGDDGIKYADFHYFWLRHNCPCLQGCRHPSTKERIIDASVVPLDIRPLHASVESDDGAEIAVTFYWPPIATKDDKGRLVLPEEEKHTSAFPVSWLRSNAYGVNRTETHELPPHDIDLVTIDYQALVNKYDDRNSEASTSSKLSAKGKVTYKAELYDKLRKYGVAIIRNRGDDTEEIIYDFIDPSADVISTHFGRIEHLRTGNVENTNNDQLGYTNSAIRLHTDLCYAEEVPGFQFLHCIQPADSGGENYFVHAESAAKYLKTEVSRRAYELLTTVNITFDRRQSNFQALLVQPILRLSDTPDAKTNERTLEQIRYSYFTHGPQVSVPFSELREWYEAQQVWDKLLYRDDFQLKADLRKGDVVIYDNKKVLHARNGFSGGRHMAGVYLKAHDLWSHLGQAKDNTQ